VEKYTVLNSKKILEQSHNNQNTTIFIASITSLRKRINSAKQ